jgi:nucleotide-binding universal stress UspA family protein
MAYRTILLAYDGSPEGRRALLEGADIARQCKSKVHVLAVIHGRAGTHVAQGLSNAEPMERTQFHQSSTAESLKFFKKHGIEAEGHVVHGDPVEEIVKLAKAVSADLVVVGHRERGPLARWWSTPTSHSLLDEIGCSLLIGRQEADESALAERG